MKTLVALISGFAAHFALYDICKSLPVPELASHTAGVLCVYPIAKWYHKDTDFDSAFLLSFLWFGLGVGIARVIRGHIEMKG